MTIENINRTNNEVLIIASGQELGNMPKEEEHPASMRQTHAKSRRSIGGLSHVGTVQGKGLGDASRGPPRRVGGGSGQVHLVCVDHQHARRRIEHEPPTLPVTSNESGTNTHTHTHTYTQAHERMTSPLSPASWLFHCIIVVFVCKAFAQGKKQTPTPAMH